jgi:hypothetical protein
MINYIRLPYINNVIGMIECICGRILTVSICYSQLFTIYYMISTHVDVISKKYHPHMQISILGYTLYVCVYIYIFTKIISFLD